MKNLFIFLGGLLVVAILFSVGKNYYKEHFSLLSSYIDFNKGDYTDQLVSGWYERETPPSGGYRWTGQKAIARVRYHPGLKNATATIYVHDISCYSDSSFRIDLQINGHTIKSERVKQSGVFIIHGEVPTGVTGKELEVSLSLDRVFVPSEIGKGGDQRKLGVVVLGLGIQQ